MDFDEWNKLKQRINAAPARPMFNEGEVWWCSLGLNVGDEQNGKGRSFARPVIVLKKFNRHIFVGVPLSTKLKNNNFYYPIKFNGIQQSVLLSHIRVMDAKRFGIKIGELGSEEIEGLKKRIADLIF